MKIKVNPNNDHVVKIRQALADNRGYCPCSLLKNEDTKCMCKEFREAPVGQYCHCGLYYKEAD